MGLGIKAPDAPVCTDLGSRGWCRYTVSDKSFYVDDDKNLFFDPILNKQRTWTSLKRYSVIVPAHSWVQFKNFVDNICHRIDCSNGSGSWQQVVNDIMGHLPQGAR